jgi:hypothetical protein
MGKPITDHPDKIEYVIRAHDGVAWTGLLTMSRVPHPEEIRSVVQRSDGTRLRIGLELISHVRVDRVETYRGQVQALHPSSVDE